MVNKLLGGKNMEINSVVVGIHYYNGFHSLRKGDEVELCFNESNEFPNSIAVKTTDGVMVGHIIHNMKQLDEQMIIENDIKNNTFINKIINENCKAIVKGIRSGTGIIFITINKEKGDEKMDLKTKIEELKNEKENIDKKIDELKKQLENMEVNPMENKLKNLNDKNLARHMALKGINAMVVEMNLNSLLEGLKTAFKEYPEIAKKYYEKYNDMDSISQGICLLIGVDNDIAIKYLNNEITGGEFDHVRVWITMCAYLFYNNLIEEVSKEEFFTEASMQASAKFLKEEKEMSEKYNDDDEEEDSSSHPTIEFVSWEHKSWAWCGSDVTLRVNGKEITLDRPLISGGNVWFDDDWHEHVEDGPWTIRPQKIPEELKPYIDEITKLINKNIPSGCCGGCV